MDNSEDIKIRASSAKLSVEEYLMKYAGIRWSLINFDLKRMRF